MKRREFLHAGAAVPALPFLAGMSIDAIAALMPRPPAVRLHRLVYDERSPDARACAAEARRLRIAARAIRGDVTEFWYHELAPRWRNAAAPIAGMTIGDSLFCLEQLARDRGLRVVFRAEHCRLPDGATEHRLSGDASHLAIAARALDGETHWGGAMARLLAHCPRGRPRISEASAIAPAPCDSMERMPLVSWVIA